MKLKCDGASESTSLIQLKTHSISEKLKNIMVQVKMERIKNQIIVIDDQNKFSTSTFPKTMKLIKFIKNILTNNITEYDILMLWLSSSKNFPLHQSVSILKSVDSIDYHT